MPNGVLTDSKGFFEPIVAGVPDMSLAWLRERMDIEPATIHQLASIGNRAAIDLVRENAEFCAVEKNRRLSVEGKSSTSAYANALIESGETTHWDRLEAAAVKFKAVIVPVELPNGTYCFAFDRQMMESRRRWFRFVWISALATLLALHVFMPIWEIYFIAFLSLGMVGVLCDACLEEYSDRLADGGCCWLPAYTFGYIPAAAFETKLPMDNSAIKTVVAQIRAPAFCRADAEIV